MLLKRQWILTVGVLAVAPTVTMAAAPWANKPDGAAQTASVDNQQVANSLAAELKKAKQAGVPIEGQDVKIVYQNGVATIQGKIKDANQKNVVSQILKNYPGVTQVNNEMTLMGPVVQTASAPTPAAPPRGMITQASYADTPLTAPAPPAGASNQAMAQQIAQAMEMAGIQGQDMEIRFKSGTATIIGAVFSPEQRMMAEQVVGQVPGVGAVDNQLQVAGGAPYGAPMQGYPQQGMPMQAMPAGYQQGMAPPAGMMPPAPAYSASSSNMVYNQPNMPQHSWPTYAAYPNSAAVSYPKEYSASAFPYIGPFYPYPQVPLGWRKSSLVWEDGSWQLEFDSKTDRWWWFMHPKNW